MLKAQPEILTAIGMPPHPPICRCRFPYPGLIAMRQPSAVFSLSLSMHPRPFQSDFYLLSKRNFLIVFQSETVCCIILASALAKKQNNRNVNLNMLMPTPALVPVPQTKMSQFIFSHSYPESRQHRPSDIHSFPFCAATHPNTLCQQTHTS